jgi:UDP-N-acetylglucosamine:LPS N-acetylglucosamine transferase
MKKIIFVASTGGHYVQLKRIFSCLDNYKKVIVRTRATAGEIATAEVDYMVTDFSRSDLHKLPVAFWESVKIIAKERPDLVVSTGALPGAIMLLVGKLFFCKTLWIDSIANTEKLSASGKIASFYADSVLTQWEHIADGKIKYVGAVL